MDNKYYEDEYKLNKDEAEILIKNLESEIEDRYNIKPPYSREKMENEVPYYIYEKWSEYYDILHPNETENQIKNKSDDIFGIDLGKSATNNDEKEKMSLDDIYEQHVDLLESEKDDLPFDAPSSVKNRDLPKGVHNMFPEDENGQPYDDGYSFDECD